jgi:hypothetical protein
MKNEPVKETHKEHFFDHLKGPSQSASGSKFFANSKFSGSPVSPGYNANQNRARNTGGASGRHGGKSR